MTPEQIKKEWDAFMEFPTADKTLVTTTSALLFAQTIAEMSRKAALTAAIETIERSYKEWRSGAR